MQPFQGPSKVGCLLCAQRKKIHSTLPPLLVPVGNKKLAREECPSISVAKLGSVGRVAPCASISYLYSTISNPFSLWALPLFTASVKHLHLTTPPPAGEFKLDVSNYTKGMYFVMAKIGDSLERQKLVVE
jgi:hypothetical protein